MADVDDVLSSAMIETEREIAAEAWDQESTPLDNDGDRSVESMGDGLEGQHDPDDDEFEEGDESEGEEGQEDEGEEGEGEEAVAAKQDGDKPDDDAKPADAEPEPQGRVPSGRLREQRERADKAEAELKVLREQQDRERSDFNKRFDELHTLVVQQRQEQPKPAPEPDKPPDFYEDPVAFVQHMNRQQDQRDAQRDQRFDQLRVEMSLQTAAALHKDAFSKAFEAVNKLDPRNPDDQVTVRRIHQSPNPGEALMSWHRRSEALREVGEDPAAYKQRVAKETREALMKDPDFRKQLLDDLRGEAGTGNNGRPNTVTRLPKSLNGVAGGSRESAPASAFDGSEQAIADSAWR